MKGITIKLPAAVLRRLKEEARASGRSVAAIVRERIDAVPKRGKRTVWDLSSHLAGVYEGSGRPASNDRPKFRKR